MDRPARRWRFVKLRSLVLCSFAETRNANGGQHWEQGCLQRELAGRCGCPPRDKSFFRSRVCFHISGFLNGQRWEIVPALDRNNASPALPPLALDRCTIAAYGPPEVRPLRSACSSFPSLLQTPTLSAGRISHAGVLWTFEELGMKRGRDYALHMLPFPPRQHRPDFLEKNGMIIRCAAKYARAQAVLSTLSMAFAHEHVHVTCPLAFFLSFSLPPCLSRRSSQFSGPYPTLSIKRRTTRRHARP